MSTQTFLANNVNGARAAAALGILSSGLLSGGLLALPTIAIPSILVVAHSRDKSMLARAWRRLYERAAVLSLAGGVTTAVAFTWAAGALYVGDERRRGKLWIVYALAGSFSAAAGLVGGNTQSSGGTRKAEYAGESAEKGKDRDVDVDGQVKAVVKWSRENWARSAVSCVGFGLGVWAIAMREEA